MSYFSRFLLLYNCNVFKLIQKSNFAVKLAFLFVYVHIFAKKSEICT